MKKMTKKNRIMPTVKEIQVMINNSKKLTALERFFNGRNVMMSEYLEIMETIAEKKSVTIFQIFDELIKIYKSKKTNKAKGDK